MPPFLEAPPPWMALNEQGGCRGPGVKEHKHSQNSSELPSYETWGKLLTYSTLVYLSIKWDHNGTDPMELLETVKDIINESAQIVSCVQ